MRKRTRDCLTRGLCEGENEEMESCNDQGCPGWSPWSEWSNCTEPCGGGFTERERECLIEGVRYQSFIFYCKVLVSYRSFAVLF